MKEDWKTLDLDKSVEISNLGRVKRNGEISTYPTDNYIRITVKKKRYYVHRLVYELFVGEIPKDMVIDHINNIKSDNRLINLRLVNRSTNSKNKSIHKKIGGIFFDRNRKKWLVQISINKQRYFIGRFSCYKLAIKEHNKFIEDKNLPKDFKIDKDKFFIEKVMNRDELKKESIYKKIKNEKWKKMLLNNRECYLSNKGRIKFLNKKNNNLIITYGTLGSSGYKQITLKNKGKSKIYLIHRLVYEAFNGKIKQGFIIDHIDGNPLNNNLDNLQELSHSLNIHKQNKRKGTTSKYKGVYYLKDRGKWRSHINIKGKRTNLGDFEKEEDAYQKYLEEYNKLFNNE